MNMTATKFDRLCADLYDCTPEQINQVVVEIKNIRELQANNVRRTLRLRDQVSFRPRKGPYAGTDIKGIVTKLNRKTAEVRVDRTTWRVSVSLLEKV